MRVDADMSKAKKMQKGHGEWNKTMKKVTVFLCIKHTPMYMESVCKCHLAKIFMFNCTQYHRHWLCIITKSYTSTNSSVFQKGMYLGRKYAMFF